jgi:Ras GTPase-activating-like protein IQGAP2/3
LLQTEPKYLAQLVYLMVPEQMEAFLDTVILTLYGDAFSPREEFLILRLFQLAIEKEMSVIKNVSDFLKADSVVPKMVITYNKRKQGSEFLKTVLGPMIKDMLQKANVNLELKPQMVYQGMINEKEIATGEKTNLNRNLTEEEIMNLPEVESIVKERISQLEQICQKFFDGIIDNLAKVPYGIRWICKQIRSIAQKNFSKSADDDILKVTGYFVYYRFINLAIVTPDNFDIINTMDLTPIARKNLVAVAKVLQNLFNFSTFTKTDKWMMALNPWIKKNLEQVRDYFTDLIEVPDPEDYLQVDKYMELTQRTKPVIIISIHEISLTHSILKQHLDKLAKDKDDPLRLILNEKDLGDPPATDTEDREIQLTLTNRFKSTMEDEISASSTKYAETKELVINTFRLIPVQNNDQDQTLVGILKSGQQYAKEKNNTQLASQIEKILENLKSLENDGLVSKNDNYASFLRDIALEVANRNEIRDQQRKEIKRLTKTLTNLRKHQTYLKDQIQQYNEYLQDCRRKHYQSKSKKKKKSKDGSAIIGPFKFSYERLVKSGVIIDSDIPAISRKKTYFYISSEDIGVFDIVAKISGVVAAKTTLELDDLLERNYNNVTRLELENIVLDVNMTIHLINKFFLKS